MKTLYTDGAGQSPSSNGAYGFYDIDSGKWWYQKSLIPITNNQAEYSGVLNALENMVYGEIIEIRSDSQLIVNQLNDVWTTQNKELIFLKNLVCGLIHSLNLTVTFVWVPRKDNKMGNIMEDIKNGKYKG